ncbi:MAG: hypothetical protein ACXAC7_05335 [Candidatus Hodarchaeales archaeon]|jgi:hypothetical protein
MAEGSCADCGKPTTSIAYKLCRGCAKDKQVCGMCLMPVQSNKYLCDNCMTKKVPHRGLKDER